MTNAGVYIRIRLRRETYLTEISIWFDSHGTNLYQDEFFVLEKFSVIDENPSSNMNSANNVIWYYLPCLETKIPVI